MQLSSLLKPHEITVGVLILLLLKEEQSISLELKNELTFHLIDLIECEGDNLSRVVNDKKRNAHEFSSLSSFGSFLHHLESELSAPDKTYLIERLKHVMNSIAVPDDLFNLFESLRSLITADTLRNNMNNHGRQNNEMVNGFSVFGIFIRKMSLGFQQLMFDGVSRVFDGLVQFMQNCSHSDQMESHSDSIEIHSIDSTFEYTNPLAAEQYVYDMATKLESNTLNDPSTLNIDLDYLISVLNEIEFLFPSITKVHYLRYLICVRQREWEGALESLHRYFDYCYCDTSNPQQPQNGTNTSGMIASYASLNLAALHYQFGHYESAIVSTQETIRIAHQKNEHECLALSLAWLFRLADVKGMQEKAEVLIKRCVERAKELEMYDLLSQSLLAYTKLSVLKFPYTPGVLRNITTPSGVWNELHESTKVNLEQNLSVLSNTTLLTRSTIWEYFGNKSLATLFANIARNNTECISQEDYLLAQSKLATSLAEEGMYSEALSLLIKIQERINTTSNVFWVRTLYSILFDYFLRTNQIRNAQLMLEKLNDVRGCCSTDLIENLEYDTEVLECRARIMIVQKRFHEAAKIMQAALQICETNQLRTVYAKRLRVMAQIYLNSPDEQVNALDYITQALEICKERHLNTLHSQFTLQHIEVILLMKSDLSRARQLVDEVSQHIEQNGSAQDRAYLYYLRAKIVLTEAKQCSDPQHYNRLINEACIQLTKTKNENYRLQSLSHLEQTLFLEAQTMNALGKTSARDKVSQQFLHIGALKRKHASEPGIGSTAFQPDIGQWILGSLLPAIQNLQFQLSTK